MVRMVAQLFTGLLFCMTLALGGCGGPAAIQPGLTLRLEDSLRDPVTKQYPPIRARVVGVGQDGKAKWEAEDVTKHFISTKEEAAQANVTEVSLASGEARIPSTDPAWAKWQNPMYLVVMVDIPGKGAEGGKPNDPRRRVLSLNKNRWLKLEGDLVLAVTRNEIVLKSEESPVKPGEF